jgi:hypothetical protein
LNARIASDPAMLKDFFSLNEAESIKEIKSADDFSGHFRNSTSLQHATVEAGLHVSDTGFKDKGFENVRLSKVVFERVTFTRCEFRDCLFVGSQFKDCEFHSCKFIDCNTHKFTLDNVYLDPRSFTLQRSYRKNASNIGVYLFQELYKNANEGHWTHFLPFADIERRRWRRHQLWYEIGRGGKNRFRIARQIVTDMLFDLSAKYGYGPLRFFLLSLLAFACVALSAQQLWRYMGIQRDNVSISEVTTVESLYYCVGLITSLGFFEFVPTTLLGKAFAIFCALFGISWLAIFTAILVRRVLR